MVKRNSTISKKRNANSDVESLDMYDFEDEGFVEDNVNFGTSIASFSFGANNTLVTNAPEAPVQMKLDKPSSTLIHETQIYKTAPRGMTPPVNGEHFTAKRSYQLRPSTIRKLNELKASHPDINVYLNTIVDAAINQYHKFILEEGGQF